MDAQRIRPQRSALEWLLDLCPADYRGYRVLLRHPAALVHLAALHVDAQVQAGHRALATARSGLAEEVPASVMPEVLAVLETEQARLMAAQRAVQLVGEALAGQRYVPRL